MTLTPFDPWKSKLCTCPPKLTLNPYTGCPHQCIYCYASSYIPNFSQCRPKKNLIPKLKKEAVKLNGELISIANSSDPYPPMERTFSLTRACLNILSNHNCKLQLVTKSPLVTRDIDILQKTPRSMVSISITTENDKNARSLELLAPLPSKRLEALKKLVQENIPVSARIDPIIPFINDNPEKLIKRLASIKVSHITCSTYKVKYDNWRRFAHAFPSIAKSLQPLYFEKGERIGRSFYLPKKMRQEIIRNVKELVENEGLKFSGCREGFPQLNSAACDGSWLIPSLNTKPTTEMPSKTTSRKLSS
jgi:DNA repair photolyase